MHSSGSGDRDATEAQEKTTRQIMEWLSEQRGGRNKQYDFAQARHLPRQGL